MLTLKFCKHIKPVTEKFCLVSTYIWEMYMLSFCTVLVLYKLIFKPNQLLSFTDDLSADLSVQLFRWCKNSCVCAVWYHFVAPPCTVYHSKRDTNPVFNATFVDRLCGSWHLPSPSDGWVISRQREVGCTWWGCGFDGHDLDSSTNSVSYSFSNSWFNFIYVSYTDCPTQQTILHF